jgi:hypothetical protein
LHRHDTPTCTLQGSRRGMVQWQTGMARTGAEGIQNSQRVCVPPPPCTHHCTKSA